MSRGNIGENISVRGNALFIEMNYLSFKNFKMKKIVAYLKDAYTELVYKVSWPSREELTSSTIIVMIASLIIALIVFGLDSLFEWILKILYGY